MDKQYFEIKNDNVQTVADVVRVLLEVPKDYLLHPLGQPCALAVDHFHQCVLFDDLEFIELHMDESAYEIQDDDDIQSNDSKETFAFYYMWEAISDSDGTYSYYSDEESAKNAFDNCDNDEKSYGIASFVNGRLEPVSTIDSTL